MTRRTCPLCGSPTLVIFGCGWDCDHVVCGAYGCEYDEELPVSTFEDGSVIDLSEEVE